MLIHVDCVFVPVAEVKASVGVGQDVEQFTVCDGTQETPFAVNVKITVCPGVNPVTVKLDGEICVPVIGVPPSIV